MIQPVLLLIASDEHTYITLIISYYDKTYEASIARDANTVCMLRSCCLDRCRMPLTTVTAPAPQGTIHALCGVSCC